MGVLDRLATSLGRPGDGANQALAAELAQTPNADDVAELAANLSHANRRIASDCIKALYELGYLAPDLIAPHVDAFLALLGSTNNRLVWGGMTALSTIAPMQPDAIYGQLERVMQAMDGGSVITIDAGVSVLAHLAAARDSYRERLAPYLLEHLRTCRPQSVAQHAERMAIAIGAGERDEFASILEARSDEVSQAGQSRIRRVLRAMER
jgi:hypothetical protein